MIVYHRVTQLLSFMKHNIHYCFTAIFWLIRPIFSAIVPHNQKSICVLEELVCNYKCIKYRLSEKVNILWAIKVCNDTQWQLIRCVLNWCRREQRLVRGLRTECSGNRLYLNNLNPVHKITPYLFQINFNIIFHLHTLVLSRIFLSINPAKLLCIFVVFRCVVHTQLI